MSQCPSVPWNVCSIKTEYDLAKPLPLHSLSLKDFLFPLWPNDGPMSMDGGRETLGKAMQWKQPRLTVRSYVLMEGDREVAHLTFRSLGSLATGECQGRTFTFKRGGFLCPFISVRKEGDKENLAILRFSWGYELGGLLTLADGRKYLFHGPSVRRDYFALTDESGRPLCKLTHESGLLRRSGEFTDLGMSYKDPEPPLLALLLWYATMMVFDEELAASSAAVPGECSIEGVSDERER